MWTWLASTWPAQWVRGDSGLLWCFPLIESLHVVAFSSLFGSVAAMDLRLLGLCSARISWSRLAGFLIPVAWCSFLGALLTGGLLFATSAPEYVRNVCFVVKVCCMAGAGFNVMLFEMRSWRLVSCDFGAVPRWARLSASISLGLWVGVLVFGRWVGFVR